MVLEAAAWVWFLAWSSALSWKDARTHRLPNAWIGMCLGGAVVWIGLLAWHTQRPLLLPIAASIAVSLVLLGIHLCGGLGMGDVKYGLVVGLYLGTLVWVWSWWAVWWGLWCAFALATPLALVRRRARRREVNSAPDQIPASAAQRGIAFGPFMTMGVWVAAASVWAVHA